MNASRLKWLALAFVTLAAARPALAYTVTVSSRAASFGGAGTVTDVPAVDGDGNPTALWQSFTDPAITCVTGSTANCVGTAVDHGPQVILRATPAPGSALASWVGCASTSTTLDIGGTVTPTTLTGHFCRVSTSAAKYVTAYFRPTQYTVTVKPGPGSVAVGPGGAFGTCAHPAVSCNYTVPAGTLLEVTASPVAPPAWEFSHWAGCTSAAPTCSTMVNGWRTIAAYYRPSEFSVGVSVTGGGLVQGDGVWCPGDCTASVTRGGSLVLEAVPYPGSEFLTWFGCPSASGTTCTLENAQSNRSVQAYFRDVGCVSCHQNPPSSHGPNVTAETDCATCHGAGFGTASVGPGHNDGRGTLAADVRTTSVPKPDEELRFEILGVDATPDRVNSVTFFQRNKAGSAITAPGTFVQIVLARLREDGSYRSAYFNVREGASYVRDGVPTAPALASASQDTMAPGSSSTTPPSGNPPGNFRLNPDGSWTFLFPDCSAGCYTAAGQTIPSVYGDSALAAGDAADLHTVAIWGNRTFSSFRFIGHASYEFRPDGGDFSRRDVVMQEACDRCHGQLEAHNQRRGINGCLGCHNPDTVDPESGNALDLASMVHRIHSGALLANDYFVVGRDQAVFEYDHVRMAPSATQFFLGSGAFAAAQGPHPPSRDCRVCHDTDRGMQAVYAFERPSRRACGSCHDAVDFAGGTNHPAATDDTSCGGCHPPASVELVHSPLYEPRLDHDFTNPAQTDPPVPPGGYPFMADLVSVHTDPNTNQLVWTVHFRLGSDPFSVNPMPFPNTDLVPCQFMLAGPTADYTIPANGSPAASCGAFAWAPTGTPGTFTYRTPNWFTTPPVKPDGYYSASFVMALRRRVSAGPDFIAKSFAAFPLAVPVRNISGNVQMVTDPLEYAVRSRRKVVDHLKCNGCHVELGYHASAARKAFTCAMCHNAKLDNAIRSRVRVADARPASSFDPAFGEDLVFLPESMSMNRYIHRIHMGGRLPSVSLVDYDGGVPATASKWVQKQGQMVIGATRSNVVGFSALEPPLSWDHSRTSMPNTMNRCDHCHVSEGASLTWALPESERAPVERTLRACTPATSATVGPWGNPADWCDVVAGIVEIGEPGVLAQSPPYVPPSGSATIVTPPMKAVCTSCHDSAATDAHADAFTGNPMTEGAVEYCATCHGAGRVLDSLLVHRPVP